MPSKPAKSTPHTTPADTTATVDAFLRELDHPHKPLVEAIRGVILGSDAAIAEGVKWNAPSYRTTEYFATTHLRQKAGVGVVLHLGAKVKAVETALAIDDPAGLLNWLAKDRAIVVFISVDDLRAKRAAFESILRSWIRSV